MSTISRFPIKNLLSQLNKREQKDNQGGDHSDDRSPVVIVGLVIAALTLFLAIMSYRHSRTGRSKAVSSLLPSYFSHNQLHQVPRTLLPNVSTTTTPSADFTRANQIFIYNDYSGARFGSHHLSTFSYQNNTVSSEDMGAT
ncbi:hypothetical protein B9Z19DRAFT_1128171 [Tuber borchii]|uniref:Uncharacterized protein n=1 Tax=Tuber borchii TaxID=42251 RepID=A0A2T6ZPZ6_TUBBO|nr:hypothetical protein B9Z19DRAFT_1128171 [Tuber borchii]